MHKHKQTADLLIGSVKDVSQINYDFSLEFKDPNFDNMLCNLTEMSELSEQPLKSFYCFLLWSVSSHSQHQVLDWATHPARQTQTSSSTPPRKDTNGQRYLICISQNSLPMWNTDLIPSKELKHNILERLAKTIYALKAYPANEEFEAVASVLVWTHPCLKEQRSACSWRGWKNSLKFTCSSFRLPSFHSLPTIHIILRCACVNSFFIIVIVVWKDKLDAWSKIVTCVHPTSFVDATSPCLEWFSVAVAALGSGWTPGATDMWAVYL